MIKLSTIILESTSAPKAVIMAGGGGVGKSYLLNQLSLDSLQQYNPDKYVEDPEHPYHNKLGPASNQVAKDVASATEDKQSFVWDTTASGTRFMSQLEDMMSKGYGVYMVMVYAHPMISYAANFERSERSLPSVAVFSTWRNAYQLIGEYQQKLKGNLSIYVSDRGGKYSKEVEGFNKAAEKGVDGIKEYLQVYNEETGAGKSTFFKPVEMSKEEETAFNQAIQNVEFDNNNRSEDKAIKTAFLKAFQKNGVGPGDDKLKDAVRKYRENRQKSDQKNNDILENIAEMLFSPTFQELLKHSDVNEIDRNVQSFLA
jgi:hypothetical protein